MLYGGHIEAIKYLIQCGATDIFGALQEATRNNHKKTRNISYATISTTRRENYKVVIF